MQGEDRPVHPPAPHDEGGYMYSSLIGKVQKAQRYAQERDRFQITQFDATFRGEHNSYDIAYDKGSWRCSCEHFREDRFCSHTMAIERMLEGVLSQAASTQ
ncbi:MAG: hypothetical protein V1724_02830 [Chloroflexota bacterium]